jgi:ethanolamine utilization microcompartment shell protein EutS
MPTITTEQAPAAKPVGVSLPLTTAFQTLIETPDYDIPVQEFAGSRRTAPGVAEISSPLIVANKTTTATAVTVEIVRASPVVTSVIAQDMVVEANDVLLIPLNGQFLGTGDILRAKAAVNSRLDATISYTVGQAEENDVA